MKANERFSGCFNYIVMSDMCWNVC